MLNVMIIPTNGFGLDGISSCIMNYYRGFDHRVIKVSLIVPKIICEENIFYKLEEEFIKNKDSVYKLERKYILKYIVSIINIIKKNNINIIHIHGSSSLMTIELIAAFLAGVKVRIVHSHNTTCEHKIIHKLLITPFNILSTHRLACGKEAGEWLFNRKEFRVLKNGINIEKFRLNKENRELLREKYQLNGKCVIGHVGGFNEQKNQKFLIDVFNELKKLNSHYKLICIGDGHTKSEIEKYIKDLELKDILLLGRRDDVSELLDMVDIMILPSLYEGLPVVAIEWQAKGIPSYVSDNITKEIAFSDHVKFLNLNLGAKKWAEIINGDNKYLCKYDGQLYVRNLGYDINENINELIHYYLAAIKEKNRNDFI